MANIEMKSFDIMSVAKICGVIGLVFGLVMALAGMFFGATLGLPAGDIMSLIQGTIVAGIGGFIFGAIYVFVYNIVAKQIGGIKFKS